MIKTEKQREELIRWIMAVKRGRVEAFIRNYYYFSDYTPKDLAKKLWFEDLLTNEELGKVLRYYYQSVHYSVDGDKVTSKEMFWLGFKSFCFNTDRFDMKEICEDFERIIKEEDEKYKEETQ
jgi:hypothetical protein